jgi:hypothetical protein
VQPSSAVGGRQLELARLVNSSGAHGQVAILIDALGEIAQSDRSFPLGLANHFKWMRLTRRAAFAGAPRRLLLWREHSIHLRTLQLRPARGV